MISLIKKPWTALLVMSFIAVTPVFAQKKDAKSSTKDTKSGAKDTKPTTKDAKGAKGGAASTPDPTGNKINPDNFYPEKLQNIISAKINAYRKGKNLDTLRPNEILGHASDDQAQYMAIKDEVSTLQSSSKKKTTGKRIFFYGGSESGDELVASQPVSRGKDYFTYEDVASIIVDKWAKGKQSFLVITNSSYIYSGVGIQFEPSSKKVYVSITFGSFNTFNIGPEKRNDLAVPYSTRKFRLKTIDDKECKSCAKFADMEKLQKGLYVKDGKVYFKYDNLKALHKLLNDKRDAIAVDIVQKEQYPCAPYNIYDTRLVNKGVMLKRKWSRKFFKKNLIEDPKKKNREIEVCLGDFPQGMGTDYELNLLVIQNKHVCRTITRKYLEDGGMQSFTPLDILPDTVSDRNNLKYKPSAETKILTFNVPFEKSKYTYAPEDVIPFIESMNEPEFIVNQISICAYSSIEGDSAKNTELQRKRAESIMAALEKINKNQFVKEIKTNDSWELFKKDVAGTKYVALTTMNKRDAISSINTTGLAGQMEEILSKERFAEINLSVTYDLTGNKEQAFVNRAFKKAVEKKDATQMLNIQQFQIVKVLQGLYTPDAVLNVQIPMEAEYASLLINQIWLSHFLKKDSLSDETAQKIYEVSKLAPKNAFASFNSALCRVKMAPIGKEKQIDSLQTGIQALYSAKLPTDRVDALNLEFQFKIIDALGDAEGAKGIVQKSVDRIRGIYKIEGSSWQNALKLAYIFMRNSDYDFSLKILEPFISDPNVDENLAFTYISLCSYYPDKLNSSKFVALMRKAKDLNPKRYCKLFGAPYLSFQVLDNPFIKEDYCKYCDNAIRPKTADATPSKDTKKKKK